MIKYLNKKKNIFLKKWEVLKVNSIYLRYSHISESIVFLLKSLVGALSFKTKILTISSRLIFLILSPLIFIIYIWGKLIPFNSKVIHTKNGCRINTVKNVKIKDIYSHFNEYKDLKALKKYYKSSTVQSYRWDKLLKSIRTYGTIKPIKIKLSCEKNYKYRICDGNHRLMAVRELYGKEYKITVDCLDER